MLAHDAPTGVRFGRKIMLKQRDGAVTIRRKFIQLHGVREFAGIRIKSSAFFLVTFESP
jgi:hypothetical protein